MKANSIRTPVLPCTVLYCAAGDGEPSHASTQVFSSRVEHTLAQYPTHSQPTYSCVGVQEICGRVVCGATGECCQRYKVDV